MHHLERDLKEILAQTKELWPMVAGKRIFVTGGTGFFGCWLLESFLYANDHLNLNAEIHVLTRNAASFRAKAPQLTSHPNLYLHEGDICSFSFPEGPFAYIIHAATEASAKLNEEDGLRMLDTIVEGTRHTLDFARHCGAEGFLLTSSGAVYGRQPMEAVPETFEGAPNPLNPRSAYGEGKRLAELLCALYQQQYGIQTKIARCFAFVGPYLPLDRHFAIGNFIRNGLNNEPIQIGGDGTPYRSYLYASELAIWLWTILLKGEAGRAYNVGAEQAVTIRELANTVAELFPASEVKIAQVAPPGKIGERYIPSTQRARTELGLTERVGLSEAILRTAAWHQESDEVGILNNGKAHA